MMSMGLSSFGSVSDQKPCVNRSGARSNQAAVIVCFGMLHDWGSDGVSKAGQPTPWQCLESFVQVEDSNLKHFVLACYFTLYWAQRNPR
jgi:hypothetical protein